MLRVLILEDNPADAELMERELRKANFFFQAKRVETEAAFAAAVRDFAPDLILSDYSLQGFDGTTALGLARELAGSVPFIVVTGSLDEETAADCIKSGAADYVLKDRIVRLGPAVRSALEQKRAREAKELAEEKLRRSEELFRRMVETAGEGIWMLNGDGVTTFANQRMADMLGHPAAQLTGRPVFDFLEEPERQLLLSKLAGLRRDVTERYDLKFRRRDGGDLWALVSATPSCDGDAFGALLMVTDITDRKRFERDLAEQAARLARSNEELDEFAHAAAHDLQEPLRTVAGFVGRLASRYAGRLDADAHRCIELAVEGVNRMREQIQDLLTYAKAVSEADLPAVESELAFRRAVENLQAAIQETGARVTADPLPRVRVNLSQLCRVFLNLIGNAIKFHGAEAPSVHVGARSQGGEWVFWVRDNGIGIDPLYAAQVFSMFRRLHPRAAYPGTGMGLAICRKIVENHGGRIWVESEAGNGSVFYFTLPQDPAPAAAG